MANAQARVIFSGRVQGVFFRAFTRDVASLLGLSGWVKNLHDGSVEAVFEGEKELVEDAIKRCRKGPPGARVEEALVEWKPFSGEFRGFSVRY
jgi:acylphosphatase